MQASTDEALVLSTPKALLLHALGHHAVWSDWQTKLAPLGKVHSTQQEECATLQGHGFVFQLQLLDEPRQENGIDFDVWVLHSVTLHTAASNANAWPHDWPLGLQAQDLSRASVTSKLGEPVVSTKSFSVFECETGTKDQSRPLGVQCHWQGQQLTNLTLLRLQECAPLPAFEYRAPAPPQPLAAAPEPALPLVQCRTGQLAPRTGVYEGLLPWKHPQAFFYNQSRMRFCLVKAQEPLPRLGAQEAEDLVVWTWIKPNWPPPPR